MSPEIINYYAIEKKLGEIFKNDARTAFISYDGGSEKELTVLVEDNASAITDLCPLVGIYLDDWDSPAEEEFIGGQMRTYLDLELIIYEMGLENDVSCERRDRLFQLVKTVINANRTIDNMVKDVQFKGGRFENAKQQNRFGDFESGFFKGATIKIRCELRE